MHVATPPPAEIPDVARVANTCGALWSTETGAGSSAKFVHTIQRHMTRKERSPSDGPCYRPAL